MPTPLRKLGQIAGIRSGHTLRGAITPDPEGDVRLLQIKDLDQDWQFNHKVLPTVVWEQRIAPPFLEQGRLLLRPGGIVIWQLYIVARFLWFLPASS